MRDLPIGCGEIGSLKRKKLSFSAEEVRHWPCSQWVALHGQVSSLGLSEGSEGFRKRPE